jgi:Ca2+-binding RTX toxin-like protein
MRRSAIVLVAVVGFLSMLGAVATAANLVGTDGDDVLRGTPGPDQIYAEGGADRLLGGGGSDYLEAGSGNDRVRAGRGVDLVIAGTGLVWWDQIEDAISTLSSTNALEQHIKAAQEQRENDLRAIDRVIRDFDERNGRECP